MALYNAVIVGEYNEILGRTKISPMTKFPPSIKIIYKTKDVSSCDPNCLLCDSKNFLLISKRIIDGNMAKDFSQHPGFIFIKFQTKIAGSYELSSETTVSDLKKAICKMKCIPIPFSQQKLVYGKNLLENDKTLMGHYNIECNSFVTLLGKIRGGAGGDLSILDLEGERNYGTGYPAERNWWSFSRGLNAIGICGNKSCPSHKNEREPKQHPTINLGFGFHNFNETVFWCPACDDFTLEPINILVSGGRSYIRFRKSVVKEGVDDESVSDNDNAIKTTILESLDDFPNFVEISEEITEILKYDLIEVTTVKFDESVFDCNLCHERIGLKVDEYERECGHYFHKKCSERFEFCPVCNAQLVTDSAVAICLSLCGDEAFSI